jgi:NAD(P)-dependent dehydrogenase (short-subunit alcohol dehydrogenase family)
VDFCAVLRKTFRFFNTSRVHGNPSTNHPHFSHLIPTNSPHPPSVTNFSKKHPTNCAPSGFPQNHHTGKKKFKNKRRLKTMATVLITGANRGLGLEFATQYTADGWDVLATARGPERSARLQALAQKYQTVRLHTLDVVDEESIQDLADALDGKPIDLLIHNSGVYPREGQKIGAIDYQGWRAAIETNVFGPIRLTEALLENVASSGRKQIAVISTSMASLRGVQGGSVSQAGTSYQYRSSKTALNMAASILAKELEPQGISVVLFDPGWVKTDMGGPHAQLTPEQSISGMRKVLAGNPEDLIGKFLGHDGTERPW